jgi:uncharacterized membrane protein (UPF0127 family)
MHSFLSVAVDSPRRFSLVKEADGTVVVPDLTLAIDSATRRKGLLGRDGLPEESGLIIAPSNAVHTFFMRFPIDIVFLTRDGDVLSVRSSVGAWRMAASFRGFAVLELAAGRAARCGLTSGERLRLQAAEA